MGLLSFLSPSSEVDKRAEQVRTGAAVPSRSERAQCWASRDLYFGCLDKAGIIDAVKDEQEAQRQCGSESVTFERDCAAQWVQHFKKYRVANYQKEQRLKALQAEGARAVSIETGPQK